MGVGFFLFSVEKKERERERGNELIVKL